jgi:SPP1 gp7 family putative phage head morphogenesis protein
MPRKLKKPPKHERAERAIERAYSSQLKAVQTAMAGGRKPPAVPAAVRRAIDRAAKETQVKTGRYVDSLTNRKGLEEISHFAKSERLEFVEQQVTLIKTYPEVSRAAIAEAVEAHRANPYRGLPAEIEERFGVDAGRARFWARDQTSKFQSAVLQARAEAVGLDRYEWSTSGDESVRATHAANDGETFSWDDPPAETGHPGNDPNCRCVAVPVLD